MQFTKLACSWVFTAATASRFVTAFRPPTSSRMQRMRPFSSSSALHANVQKLIDPRTELLDNVDVFIFDCDGVIWRVCMCCTERVVFFFFLDCLFFQGAQRWIVYQSRILTCVCLIP
jgi:hypothetical protein